MAGMQLALLDQFAPAADPGFGGAQRRDLGAGAWVEYTPDWLRGPHRLLETLVKTCDWQQLRRPMYERMVNAPRLMATEPGSQERFGFDASEVTLFASSAPAADKQAAATQLRTLGAALSDRYERELSSVTLGYYRDGQDSVAYHGDRLGALRSNTVVAIVSVGARRRFLLRRASGGPSHSFLFGEGDLLVMGGTCQETCEHAVPKMARCGPRVAIMFRERVAANLPKRLRAL